MEKKRDERGRYTSAKMFTEESREITISLRHTELKAIIQIHRSGQEAAYDSDKVKVCCDITLPCYPLNIGQYDLHPAIQFNERLSVMGDDLYRNWGNLEKNQKTTTNYRYNTKMFTGTSFSNLFSEAEKYCKDEIEKLNNKLDVRHKALIDADY